MSSMQPDRLSAFLHSEAWAAHLGATRDNAGSLFVRQKLPGGGSYWQGSRAFLPEDWRLPDFCQKSWWVRIQPDSFASEKNLSGKRRIVPSIQPRQTLVLDLTKSEEMLLAEMKQKHRYNLRLAEKHGVKIEILSEKLEDSIPRFWKLLSETADRHSFRTHTKAHYTSIVRNLEPAQMCHLVFATHEGHDVAAAMIITHNGVGTYLHGGSTYADRALMAPNLLHWEVIRHLKAHDCVTYDFWGIHTVDGAAISGHASEGTTRFKLGFGGSIIDYPPTYDIILNPICYTGYRAIQALRSKKRAFS